MTKTIKSDIKKITRIKCCVRRGTELIATHTHRRTHIYWQLGDNVLHAKHTYTMHDIAFIQAWRIECVHLCGAWRMECGVLVTIKLYDYN